MQKFIKIEVLIKDTSILNSYDWLSEYLQLNSRVNRGLA